MKKKEKGKRNHHGAVHGKTVTDRNSSFINPLWLPLFCEISGAVTISINAYDKCQLYFLNGLSLIYA